MRLSHKGDIFEACSVFDPRPESKVGMQQCEATTSDTSAVEPIPVLRGSVVWLAQAEVFVESRETITEHFGRLGDANAILKPFCSFALNTEELVRYVAHGISTISLVKFKFRSQLNTKKLRGCACRCACSTSRYVLLQASCMLVYYRYLIARTLPDSADVCWQELWSELKPWMEKERYLINLRGTCAPYNTKQRRQNTDNSPSFFSSLAARMTFCE